MRLRSVAKNFRSYVIAWLDEHEVKGHPHQRGVRHEVLLDDHLRVIVDYDPLNPRADICLTAILLALPYEETKRMMALEDMLMLNYRLLSIDHFAASICSYIDGDYIGLVAYASALDEDAVYFEERLGRYFDVAFYARGQLNKDGDVPPPGLRGADRLDIRYL